MTRERNISIKRRQELKEFHEYLKEQGLLKKFKYNSANHLLPSGPLVLKLKKLSIKKQSFIMHAFKWDATPEGYRFWKNEHIKCLEHFDKMNTQNVWSILINKGKL